MRDHARGDLRGTPAAGRNDPIDALGAREPLDRLLVLDRDDRAAVGVAEPGGRRVAVGDDKGQAPAPGIREDAQLSGARPENEEARHTPILAMGAAGPFRDTCGGIPS